MTSRVVPLTLAVASLVCSGAPTAIVPSGTDVLVCVNETIDSKTADEGRVYAAQLDQDLLDEQGRVAVPKGSKAELLVRNVESERNWSWICNRYSSADAAILSPRTTMTKPADGRPSEITGEPRK